MGRFDAALQTLAERGLFETPKAKPRVDVERESASPIPVDTEPVSESACEVPERNEQECSPSSLEPMEATGSLDGLELEDAPAQDQAVCADAEDATDFAEHVEEAVADSRPARFDVVGDADAPAESYASSPRVLLEQESPGPDFGGAYLTSAAGSESHLAGQAFDADVAEDSLPTTDEYRFVADAPGHSTADSLTELAECMQLSLVTDTPSEEPGAGTGSGDQAATGELDVDGGMSHTSNINEAARQPEADLPAEDAESEPDTDVELHLGAEVELEADDQLFESVPSVDQSMTETTMDSEEASLEKYRRMFEADQARMHEIRAEEGIQPDVEHDTRETNPSLSSDGEAATPEPEIVAMSPPTGPIDAVNEHEDAEDVLRFVEDMLGISMEPEEASWDDGADDVDEFSGLASEAEAPSSDSGNGTEEGTPPSDSTASDSSVTSSTSDVDVALPASAGLGQALPRETVSPDSAAPVATPAAYNPVLKTWASIPIVNKDEQPESDSEGMGIFAEAIPPVSPKSTEVPRSNSVHPNILLEPEIEDSDAGDAQPGGGTTGSSGLGTASSGDDSSNGPLSYSDFIPVADTPYVPPTVEEHQVEEHQVEEHQVESQDTEPILNADTELTPEPVIETETRLEPAEEPDDTNDSSADVKDFSAGVEDATTSEASPSGEQPPAEIIEPQVEQSQVEQSQVEQSQVEQSQVEQSQVELSQVEQSQVELSEALEPAVSREAVSRESRGATDYEVSLAGRLLHSEFGVRMGQLSSHLDVQLPGDGPHTVLLLGLDDDPQQTDVIAGLGMFVCGKRNDTTLLVDADTERRAMSQNFQKTGRGVLESMNGTAGWQDSVQQTSCEKLSLLPCGSEHSALERSESDRVQWAATTNAQWKQEFGLILVDGGLATSSAAEAIAAVADATFICVRLGESQRDELLAAKERLAEIGAQLKGCITLGPVT